MTRLSVLLAAALALAACDAAGPADPGNQVVVSAFLEAGGTLPPVRLTRTVPLGEVYDPATAAISDASVRVELLGAGGAVEQAFPYVYAGPDGAGTYVPRPEPGALPTALPGRTYRLTAEALGQTVTAETTVPETFEVLVPPPDSVVYQYNVTGPPLRITTSSTAGRQSVYVATTAALQPDEFEEILVDGETRYRSRNLPGKYRPVPFVRLQIGADCREVGAFLECERDPNDLFTSGSSPIINESSYILPGDGTAIVNVPWLAFGFYGPATIALVALDDALKDFVETQTLQQNPTTISPGEIPNVTTNVAGGLGVFGSFARVEAQTTLVEAPRPGA